MLSKIAFRNVGKSFRDYAIYVFTLIFAVCIFYMFNSIYAQQDIIEVTETTNVAMKSLTKMLSYISVFVAVILGFLIVYANNFFIKRRKKEFGIYMTLGMEKQNISRILIIETSLMAIVSLLLGLIFGIFGSQFMSVFTAKMFEADMMRYKFIFSPDAAFKSILYFGIIFLVVIVFNAISLGRIKLVDLIYAERKNESLKVNAKSLNTVIFLISCLCIGIAYYLILRNGIIDVNNYVLIAVILGITGTFLFFMSFSGILINFIISNKNLYFKDLNIFTLRQFTSKVNTNFVSMAVVCLIMFIVIQVFSSGYSIQSVLSGDLKSSIKYDFSLYNYNYKNEDDNLAVKSVYENLPKNFKNDENILKYHEYKNYEIDGYGSVIGDYDLYLSSDENNIKKRVLNFIKLTDYNELRKLQGLPYLEMKQDKYKIIYGDDKYSELAKQFLTNNIALDRNGVKLTPESIENLSLDNGNQFITMVIDDEFAKDMKTSGIVLNIICKDEIKAKFLENKLTAYLNSIDYKDWAFKYNLGKLEMFRENTSTKLIVSFLAIYLGLVFMVTSAAIIAIQQLSEAADNKKRYDLLKKLGADKKMLDKALFNQIYFYFLTPLMLAIIHSIVGFIVVNKVIERQGEIDVGMNIISTGIFVLVVYGVYFLLTYIGSKNIINRG